MNKISENLASEVKKNLEEFAISKNEEDILNTVIEALAKIDRKNFMDKKGQGYAYFDMALPIGYGQTISQPTTVARTLLFAKICAGNDVLEIGTGSGYTAALISNIVYPGKVLTTEIIPSLVDMAKNNIGKVMAIQGELAKKLNDITILNQNVFEDSRGLGEFDRIIISAGIEYNQKQLIQDFAIKHLRNGGILVCPYTSGPLIRFIKKDAILKEDHTDEQYVFVPLL